MPERTSLIRGDVEIARLEHLPSCQGAPVGMQITRLELEEDCVIFEVAGYDGEFTAFLADPYPAGETTVYGPDDMEFQHAGTVAKLLANILKDLATRRKSSPAKNGVADAAREEVDDEEDDDEDEGSDDEELIGIVDESPMEPRLLADIESTKAAFGKDTVTFVQLSDSAWRVRLRFGLTGIRGSCQNVELVDDTTAGAWGLHPRKKIVVELHLPMNGYLQADMPHNVVKAVWQEDHDKFALEKQIMKILLDFCAVALSTQTDILEAIDQDTCGNGELETMRRYMGKKVAMIFEAQHESDLGFLGQLLCYAQVRIPTIHEFCAICDQPFFVPPMLLRTVCCRDLCTYQFAEFGEKITSAEGVNTQAEIVDLLVCMLIKAALSSRYELILDPYPCVYGGVDGREIVFHPKQKNYTKLKATVEQILKLRQERASSIGASWSALKSLMSPEAAGLLKWAVASNRSFLAPLQDDQRIQAFDTPFQYLLISAPPDREKEFQKLKREHGSTFAYHGSPAENWHSILRNGLRNASNTKLMVHGAAHGPGIYLAVDSQMSLHYAMRQQISAATQAAPIGSPEVKRQKVGNRSLEHMERMIMLAVCEVINSPSLRKCDRIWVAPTEDTVITRFFLVFPEMSMSKNVPIRELEGEIRACMERLRVGCM